MRWGSKNNMEAAAASPAAGRPVSQGAATAPYYGQAPAPEENPFRGNSSGQTVLDVRPLEDIPPRMNLVGPAGSQSTGNTGTFNFPPVSSGPSAAGYPDVPPLQDHPVDGKAPAVAPAAAATGAATAAAVPAAARPATSAAAAEQPLQEPRGAGKGLKGFIQLIGIVLYWLALTALVAYELVCNVQLIKSWDSDFVVQRTPPDPNAGDPGIQKERNIFWILMLVTGVAGAVFFIMAFALVVVGQLRAIVRHYKYSRRLIHFLCIWVPVIVIVLSEFTKLIVLQSIINKMRYQGEWCDSPDEKQDIRYAFNVDQSAGKNCQVTPMARLVKFAVILALTQVGFNTIVFFTREPKRIMPKVLALLPAIVLTALLWVKPVTSMMVFAFSQRDFIMHDYFNFSAEMIITLISMVLAIILSLMMGYVLTDVRLVSRLVNRPLACCHLSRPEYDAKALEEEHAARNPTPDEPAPRGRWFSRFTNSNPGAPPKPLTVRRAIKLTILQLYYIGQLPIAFGLVAPIVMYVSLHIWNFWVALDLIVGAVLMLIILLVVLARCCTRDHWLEA